MPEARSNQEVWWCLIGNLEHKWNTNITREMKEQLVQLLLQLAGVLWPKGKSKSSTICFYFWSCLNIGRLTCTTCSLFEYSTFFTFTLPYLASCFFFLFLLSFPLLSFPNWFLDDLIDTFHYIFAAHDTIRRNQNRILPFC